MSETLNPYIAGSPITGSEMFFGRDDVFTFVRQALSGQHRDHVLVLYGQRRTGKTSVLYQMSRQLGPQYVCIFTDLHGLALNGLDGFLWELANHITRALRREYQVSLPPVARVVFQDDSRSAFENNFLDSVWEAIGERHLLLMLDEAIRLEEQVQAGKMDIEVFDYLRHLMQHYPRLNFLFSLGSGLEEMQKEYAFLFNVALYKKISFLDRSSAEALITEPVKDRCPFQPQAVDRILEVTSAHPYFTQLVCHSLFNRCQGAGGITAADVDSVLDEAVERGLAVLKHVWEESTPGEKAVLAAMASASATPDAADSPPGSASGVALNQMAQIWDERGVAVPENEVARAVRSLVARDVIASYSRGRAPGGDAFAFTVDLMRLWVQKFRRVDWVKDEIKDEILEWIRRDREAERDSLAHESARKVHLAGQVGESAPTPGSAAPGRLFKLSPAIIVYLIVGLAGLLGIIYYASGLLNSREANNPSLPVSPTETQGGASYILLGGDAAKVSDLAVLEGYVWAATEGGLVRWSADRSYQVYPWSQVNLDCMNTITAQPSDNTLWMGCGGVSVLQVEGDQLSQQGYYNRDDGLGIGLVKELALDSDGTIWAAGNPTEGRPPPITAFRGQDADPTWQYSETINQQLSSLFGDSFDSLRITSMFIDSSGGFWLGLQEAGIVYVSENKAVHFSENEGVGSPGLGDRRIREILVDQNGMVWAAASDQGLLRLKPGAAAWETVDLGSQGSYISTVAEFADGSLWVGGNSAVGHSEDGGETWNQVGSEEGLGSEIDALVQDEDGRVWAGAYDGGVSIWDGEHWTAFQK